MTNQLNMATLLAFAMALCTSLFAAQSQAADYAAEWGPKVGTTMPAISAPDQDGKLRSLADLQGEKGVLIFFNRSADW